MRIVGKVFQAYSDYPSEMDGKLDQEILAILGLLKFLAVFNPLVPRAQNEKSANLTLEWPLIGN